jgi:hypothetical protein
MYHIKGMQITGVWEQGNGDIIRIWGGSDKQIGNTT